MLRNRLIVVLALLLAGTAVTSSNVVALSAQDEADFAQNNNLFYEPCVTTSSGKTLGGEITISGATAEEKVWSGLASFLTDVQAAGVMGNIGQEDGNYNPVRREIGQSGNLYNRNAQVGMGFVQWSFGRRVNLLNYVKSRDASLIKYFEDDSNAQITGDKFIKKVGEDIANKVFQVEIEFLKSEIDKSYKTYYKKTDIDDATVWFRKNFERAGVYSDSYRKQKAHAAYNKFAGKEITGSSEEAGESSEDGELPSGGDGSGISCNGNNEGSKNLNAAAVALAWPEGTASSKSVYPGGTGTEAFNNAHKKFTSGSHDTCAAAGASCDIFVSTVVRYSGYDKKYPITGPGTQLDHAKAHPELWEVIDWSDGDKSKVKPGDIIVENNRGHTQMIVENSKGEIKYASASHCDYYGKIKSFYAPRQPAYIVRATGANNSTAGVSDSGVTPSSSDGSIAATGQNNGDIAASAIALAWPEDKYKNVYKEKATDLYANYFKTLAGNDTSDCYKKGKYCSGFVNTTLSYAGAKKTGKDKIKDVKPLRLELEADEDWEEIKPAGDKFVESDLKSGDVLFYYKSGDCGHTAKDVWNGMCVYHVAIFVETQDGGRIAQAHRCKTFGYISKDGFPNGKRSYRVYRWKKQGNGSQSSSCDVCADENEGSSDDGGGEGGDVGLKSGGLTKAEATKLVDIYKGYAGKNNLRGDSKIAAKYYIKVGCHGNLFLNCPSFVKYFINRYTTKTWKSGLTGNGNETYKYAANALGLKTGSKPQPYAIFSDNSYSPGHTGIVLAVDESKKTMLVGEAGCMSSSSTRAAYNFIGVHERSINKYHLYSYLGPYVKLTGE